MYLIKTANGAGRGTIEQAVTAELPQGGKVEAVRLFICYEDGRAIRYNTTGEELRGAIARGDIRIYGRDMAQTEQTKRININIEQAQVLNLTAGSLRRF